MISWVPAAAPWPVTATPSPETWQMDVEVDVDDVDAVVVGAVDDVGTEVVEVVEVVAVDDVLEFAGRVVVVFGAADGLDEHALKTTAAAATISPPATTLDVDPTDALPSAVRPRHRPSRRPAAMFARRTFVSGSRRTSPACAASVRGQRARRCGATTSRASPGRQRRGR